MSALTVLTFAMASLTGPVRAQTSCPAGGGEDSNGTTIPLLLSSASLCAPSTASAAQYDAAPFATTFNFGLFLPDAAPRDGTTNPVRVQFNVSSVLQTISSLSCPGGTVAGVGTSLATISLSDGASCALTVGATGDTIGFSGATLSRSGAVYTLSAGGTLAGGPFGGSFGSPTTTTITSDTPDPSVFGQNYTVSVSVTSGGGTPTGTVTISDGTNNCLAGLTGGTGSCVLPSTQVGPLTLTANYPATGAFHASSDTEPHTVNQAPQTITFTNPGTQVFGVAPFGLTATASSGLTPIVFASTTPAVCTVSGSTVTIVAAGSCSITADQAGDTNYLAAPTVTETFTVNQAPQTITFTNPGPQVFGVAPFGLTATASSGLTPIVFASTTPAVCTVSGSTVTIVAAGSCSITADQAGDTNYLAAPTVTETFTVNQAPQTITFTNPGPQVFGVAPFGLTATASSGLTPIVFASTTPAVCTVSGSTVTVLAAGSCSITADQAGNTNYQPAPTVSQTFSVGPSSQTITFTNPGPQVFGVAPFGLTATASSGLTPIVFASTTPAVCTVSGSTVTIVAAGSCSITADQAGDTNYQAAPTVTETFTVGPAPQTITFTNPGPQVFGVAPFGLTATASSGLTPIVFASTTPAVCTVSGSTVTIVAAGSCSITADQAGDANYQPAPTVTETFVVNPAATTASVTSSVNPSFESQAVIFTATLSPASATGTVTFLDGATVLGTGPVSGGIATLTVTTLSAGSHPITASYGGDPNHSGSTSSVLTQVVIPNGTVVLQVTTAAGDGTFNFSSPTTALAVPVTTSGGSGQSPGISLNPGTYTASVSLPAGFGLASVNCSDSDSVGSVAGRSVTINLQSAETVTCTFATADSRTKATQAIGRFLKRRNDLLLSSEPNADRQIARLNGAPPSGGNGSGSSFAGSGDQKQGLGGPRTAPHTTTFGLLAGPGWSDDIGSRAPLTDDGVSGGSSNLLPGLTLSMRDARTGSFAISLHAMRLELQAKESRRVASLLGKDRFAALGAAEFEQKVYKPWAFDIWAEGRFTYFDDDSANAEANGHFGVLYFGADYVLSPSLLIGALVQFDDTSEVSTSLTTRIHGKGWMVGPYATLKLASNVYLQARAAWGHSKNDISPFLTYTDTFNTERWLVRGRIRGDWNFGALRFSPSIAVAYIEERQEAYVDSLSVFIPGQTASLGLAEFGPKLSYTHRLNDQFLLLPSASLKGIWKFSEDNNLVAVASEAGAGELRGKAEVGLKIVNEKGGALTFTGIYDGIGDDDFRAYSGALQLRLPLN